MIKRREVVKFDFSVPGDRRIENEKDKIEKYQNLGLELQKIWNVKVKIIPLVVGSLGAIPKQFEADWYYSRNSTSSEDSFTWNG